MSFGKYYAITSYEEELLGIVGPFKSQTDFDKFMDKNYNPTVELYFDAVVIYSPKEFIEFFVENDDDLASD